MGAQSVRVIPNGIDIERWNHKREPRHREFTIVGWSGSIGHEDALHEYAPALDDLLRRRDDIAIASVGRPISRYFPQDIRHRFHDVGFVPLPRHPQVLTQFHINIGPTLDKPFYAAKSDLRALEAFASDSVFIGGAITYGDTMDAAEVGVNAVHVPEVMVARIEAMIDQPKLNHDIRKRQLKWVRENGLIQNTAPLWRDAINSVLP